MLDALLSNGFRNDDISVLIPDQASTRQFATEKNTKASEGASTGAAAGSAIGGTEWAQARLWGASSAHLSEFGIPEYEAKRYEGRMKKRRYSSIRTLRYIAVNRQGHSQLHLNSRRW
jgi:hypothetical protein